MKNAKENGSRGGTVERLTERNESGGITVRDMPAALAKLAELEDKEERRHSLMKAVKTIAEFCDNLADCGGCPFSENDGRRCALNGTLPSEWDVFGMNTEEEQALKEGTG